MSTVYSLTRGHSPLIVSMPHSGEALGRFGARMTDAARQIPDTDWHLPRLYDFLPELAATVLVANYSRYVIDLNRDPSGKSLYPGQNVTELCPTTTFAEEPVYRGGEIPDTSDVGARVKTYWQPYHTALAAEIERVKAMHGYALVWDAHSIRSHVPRFFDGRLPDFNLGTSDGASCDEGLAKQVYAAAKETGGFTSVLNGRFKGGYITRRYGRPAEDVHAVQLELSQATYMEESYPFVYRESAAPKVAAPIRRMMEAMLAWRPEVARFRSSA